MIKKKPKVILARLQVNQNNLKKHKLNQLSRQSRKGKNKKYLLLLWLYPHNLAPKIIIKVISSPTLKFKSLRMINSKMWFKKNRKKKGECRFKATMMRLSLMLKRSMRLKLLQKKIRLTKKLNYQKKANIQIVRGI